MYSPKRKAMILFIATIAMVLVWNVASASSHETEKTTPSAQEVVIENQQTDAQKIHHFNKLTFKYNKLADAYAHRLGTHVTHPPFPTTTSVVYAENRAKFWKKTAIELRSKWEAKLTLYGKADKDFHLALKLASNHYKVSYGWLHSCAHSEGHIDGYRNIPGTNRPDRARGIDPFIMNHGGSGAGGWMQFMKSTYESPVYASARSAVPAQYRNWKSRVGQAYLAAYLFKTEGSGQWTGDGC